MAQLKNKRMLLVEKRFKEPLETLLPRIYNESTSPDAAAKKLGVSHGLLYYWGAKMGYVIESRMVPIADSKRRATLR